MMMMMRPLNSPRVRGGLLYFFLFMAHGCVAPFMPLIWRSKGLSGEQPSREHEACDSMLMEGWAWRPGRVGSCVCTRQMCLCLHVFFIPIPHQELCLLCVHLGCVSQAVVSVIFPPFLTLRLSSWVSICVAVRSRASGRPAGRHSTRRQLFCEPRRLRVRRQTQCSTAGGKRREGDPLFSVLFFLVVDLVPLVR